MQSQITHQRAVTAKQSLLVVQTLLRAGFGCLTYLRGLLPDDNFTEGHLTASESPSGSQTTSQDASNSHERKQRSSGSVKVKTIKKGWSTEGDKLLMYLEEGIFDALEKQYLRSFIFAVYLDDEDPENVVETYTFNFSYHSVAGMNSKVPVMTLGERLDKMTLGHRASSKPDPVSDSLIKGKAPTLGEVKQSVKNLIKHLVTAMQLLHALPKRRFATFKLFYMEYVPDNYEPPHFRAGDANNKYFFTTHAKTEMPEKMSVGSLVTPHHGVEMHVASVTDVIPQVENDDTARFGDLVSYEGSSYTATQTMTLMERDKLIQVQRQDALLRKVVWDAETFANPSDDCDADGECDLEYQGPYDDPLTQQPRGIRRADGTVVEIAESIEDEHMDSQSAYPGMIEDQPNNIKKARSAIANEENLPTQLVESTPYAPPDPPLTEPTFPPHTCIATPKHHQESLMSRGIETQFVKNLIEQRDADDRIISDGAQDAEMIDMETQLPVDRGDQSNDDTITCSPSLPDLPGNQNIAPSTPVPTAIEVETDVRDCDCGVSEDEDCGACQCEGACGRWLHVWCMGYHSVNDPRLPQVFRCFICRLRNDPQIELLDSRNLTSEYIAKWKDLSLFRRALKIVQAHRPENVTRFKELLGSEVSIAGQAWKRLETEGFIALQTTQLDSVGLLETKGIAAASRKGKGKQKTRKNIKRSKYAPVPEIMNSNTFQGYFQPAKEASLLGMTKLKQASTRSSKAPITQATNFKVPQVPQQAVESQTQPESQIQLPGQQASEPQPPQSKRKTTDQEPQTRKRMKISIGVGINLED